jgi:hypothetical protein
VGWGVITANALSAVAIIVAALGVSRTDARAKKAEAGTREAEAQAARAIEAAERSASAVERVAGAMERQSIEAEQHSATPGVAWRLEHHQGDTYLLTNAGRGTAYDVRAEADDSMITRDLPDGATLGPDEAVTFLGALTLGTTDDTVTVTWAATPGGERLTWRRPLPPRPPRR